MTPWMEAVLDHLWQSTLFTVAAALLALAYRRHRAWIRHGIWAVSSLKFLIPFGVLAAIGSSHSRIAEPLAPFQVAAAIRLATTPFSNVEYTAFPLSDVGTATASPLVAALPWLVALTWATGAGVVVARWRAAWRTLAKLRREAVPLESGREWQILRRLERRLGVPVPLTLLATAGSIEPGLFGMLRPALLWPRAMSRALDDDQIEAIFAHEICHARRWDNVTTALQMAVEAIFWFHPVTWWVGARLLHERERACDEWVVQRGSEPDVYAESILRTCRSCLESPLACAPGITGADLRTRIERIITSSPRQALGRLGGMVLVLAGLGALAAPVTAGGLMPAGLGLGGSRFLQSPRQTMAFAPRRDVDPAAAASARFSRVSVTPHAGPRSWGSIRPWTDGRLTATGVTLRELIVYAYSPDSPWVALVRDGAPEWIGSARYDIIAWSPRPFVNDASGEPSELTGMLRNMLADQFGLHLRAETRELVVRDLVRVPGRATSLRLSSARCWRPQLGPPPAGLSPLHTRLCATSIAGTRLSAEAVPIAWLADTLGALAGQVVRDATGLDGLYDVDLAWARGGSPADQPVAASLRDQLGLDLVSATGPVEVLVVTDARRPVANRGGSP